MKKVIISSLTFAGLFCAGSANAQNPAANQQVDALRLREFAGASGAFTNAAPEFYPGETSDIGPQSLLERKTRQHWVRAMADEQWFYTDNMFLGDKDHQSVDVLVSTINVAIAPDGFDVLGGKFSPEVGYQHQWFSYGILDNETISIVDFDKSTIPTRGSLKTFDFNAQTVFGGCTFTWHGFDFSAGLDYRRLMDSNDYNEFYREIAPRWGVHYTWQVTENKSIIVGYEGDYRFTETQNHLPLNSGRYLDRADHSLMILGNWHLCSHAILQPYYRLQYSGYSDYRSGREDWLNSFGLALQLPITQNVSLRTFVNYDTMHTDGAYAQNFEKLDAGLGVNLSVRF